MGGAEIEIFGNFEKKIPYFNHTEHLKFGMWMHIYLGGVGTLSVGGGVQNILGDSQENLSIPMTPSLLCRRC